MELTGRSRRCSASPLRRPPIQVVWTAAAGGRHSVGTRAAGSSSPSRWAAPEKICSWVRSAVANSVAGFSQAALHSPIASRVVLHCARRRLEVCGSYCMRVARRRSSLQIGGSPLSSSFAPLVPTALGSQTSAHRSLQEHVAFKPGCTAPPEPRQRSLRQGRRRPVCGSRRRLLECPHHACSNGRRRRFASGVAGAGRYKEVRGRGRAPVQNCGRALFARPPQQTAAPDRPRLVVFGLLVRRQ
jgi:hypothetical protein